MIFKPQNVYPHNTAIDASEKNSFSFIFNGDHLKSYDFEFYDASNNKFIKRLYVPLSPSAIYNNYEARTIMSPGTFENGKNYKYKMNIYQEKSDIFAMQGTVRSISISRPSVQIPITYGITEIQNPIYYTVNGKRTLYGACYMEIDNGTVKERRMITNYDPTLKYGTDDGYGNYDYKTLVTLEAPFSFIPAAGTTYKIYKNYITSPEYFFECSKRPIIAPTVKLNEFGNIECISTYTQEQNIGIKNYKYSLFKDEKGFSRIESVVSDSEYISKNTIPITVEEGLSVSIFENDYITITYTKEDSYTISETRLVKNYDSINNIITVKDDFSTIPPIASQVTVYGGKVTLVRESGLIYNQTLKYEFNDILRDSSYTVKLEVTTQNNMIAENSVLGHFSSISTENENYSINCSVGNTKNDVIIEYDMGVNKVLVEREDVITGVKRRIVFNYLPCHDYLAASKKSYKYRIIPIIKQSDQWVYGSEYLSNIQSPNWCCWTIYSLVHRTDLNSFEPNREKFQMDQYWKLYVEPEESEITQNLNRYVHKGFNSKPKITINDNNYISGSLTCKLSQVECPEMSFQDTIYMVEAWRKFISENSLYLLKNPKGEMWIVSVSDNPTTSYDYSYSTIPTTISFTYTECRDINEIAIIN